MRLLLHKSDLIVGLANVARCTPGSIVLADNLPDIIGYVDSRPLPKKHGRVRRVRVEQLKLEEVVGAVQPAGFDGQGHFEDQSKQLEAVQKLRDQGVV